MWKVDSNISLESTFVKEEVVVASNLRFVTKPTSGDAVPGLRVATKEERRDADPIPEPDPYLYPYMEVTVKIEPGGLDYNEEQLLCNTEMKLPKFLENNDYVIEGSYEKIKPDFSLSRKEMHLFQNCFVKLERMNLDENQYSHITFQKNCSVKQSLTTKTSKHHAKNLKAKCSLPKKHRINKEIKSFECTDCRKKFKTKYSLLNHTKTHTGERPYSCSFCNKAFSKDVNLTRHERIHTGEKPYFCNICKKGFTIKHNLVTHIRIHTQEKPFTCDFCGKQFVHTSDLKKHERIHTGEKPFTCDICMKQFARKFVLIKHLKAHAKKLEKLKKKKPKRKDCILKRINNKLGC